MYLPQAFFLVAFAFALFFWTSLTPFVACTGLNPVIWYYEELQEALPGSGKYLATMSAPIYGWTGFLVELVWEYRYLVSASLRRRALTRETSHAALAERRRSDHQRN